MVRKHKGNQFGFGLLEALLIIFIVTVICFGGYYVWFSQHKAKTATSVVNTSSVTPKATTAPNNSYAGWNTATLTNEKLSFSYPSGWQLTDYNAQDKVNDGSDAVQVKSPSGVEVNITTENMEHPSNDGPQTIAYTDPTTFLGQKAYIVYSTNTTSASSSIGQGWVSFSSTDFPGYNANPFSSPDYLKTRNMNSQGWLLIEVSVPANSSVDKSAIISNIDYTNAKLIVQSMHY